MFVTRLISGIVMLAALAALFVVGTPWLTIATGILSIIGIFELLRVFGVERTPMAVITYAAAVAHYLLIVLNLSEFMVFLFIGMILLELAIYVFSYPKYRIGDITGTIFAFFYVALMLSYIPMTRELPEGAWLVWLIIIGSWGADTCAYCVGMLIGKHHFSELSPKKTVEGCIGGAVGAGIIALVYSFFFPYEFGIYLNVHIAFPLTAVVSAVVSMIGDLAASAIKRNYDIKDYSHLIPGHGGVLDRFDSVIFVAPFVYYLLILL